MSSRTSGALRGIWGSPQQAETERFSLQRKSPGLPKGYHTALLAIVSLLRLPWYKKLPESMQNAGFYAAVWWCSVKQQLLFLPVVTSVIGVVGLTPCFYFLAATATDFDVLFPYATAFETKTVCRPR